VKEEEEVEKSKKEHTNGSSIKERLTKAQSVYVRSNLKGEMVFREQNIKFKWSWFRGVAMPRRVKLGDKVKPNDEESGAKYMFRGGLL
jgi:hypothetical protein